MRPSSRSMGVAAHLAVAILQRRDWRDRARDTLEANRRRGGGGSRRAPWASSRRRPTVHRQSRPNVRIGDYFGLGHPIVMILAYYNCPMLCGVVLRSATRGLGALPLQLGNDYQALTVSIDPHDSSAAAVVKRGAALAGGGFARLTEPSATRSDSRARPWPFLTGAQPPSIA